MSQFFNFSDLFSGAVEFYQLFLHPEIYSLLFGLFFLPAVITVFVIALIFNKSKQPGTAQTLAVRPNVYIPLLTFSAAAFFYFIDPLSFLDHIFTNFDDSSFFLESLVTRLFEARVFFQAVSFIILVFGLPIYCSLLLLRLLKARLS